MEPEDFVTFTITPSESLDDPSWSHDWVQQWKDDEQPLLFVEVQLSRPERGPMRRREIHFSFTELGHDSGMDPGSKRYTLGPFTTAELRLLAESLVSAADEAERASGNES